MRRHAFIAAAAAALAAAPAAAAQFTYHTLWLPKRPPTITAKCYDGRWQPKPEDIATGPQRADAAMQAYLRLAASSTDLVSVFTGEGRFLTVDGTDSEVRSATDPWAARVAKVEQVGFQAGNHTQGVFRALWRAVAPDGTVLGIYDGTLIRYRNEDKFINLRLYPAGREKQPASLGPFCLWQGDIQKWYAAKERRKAGLAAQRAARLVDPATQPMKR